MCTFVSTERGFGETHSLPVHVFLRIHLCFHWHLRHPEDLRKIHSWMTLLLEEQEEQREWEQNKEEEQRH